MSLPAFKIKRKIKKLQRNVFCQTPWPIVSKVRNARFLSSKQNKRAWRFYMTRSRFAFSARLIAEVMHSAQNSSPVGEKIKREQSARRIIHSVCFSNMLSHSCRIYTQFRAFAGFNFNANAFRFNTLNRSEG